jgi:hypothetical protein
MSRAMIAADTMRPFASVTGDTVSDTAIRLPSFRTRSVSKLSIDSPANTVWRSFCHSPARSGASVMPLARPIASLAL